MSNLNTAFRTEVSRLARKEARQLAEPVHRAALAAKRSTASLKQRVNDLERELAALRKSSVRASPVASQPTDTRLRRLRTQGIKALRSRLGLSAEDLGRLLGVSGQAIYNWEQGKSRPRPKAFDRLVQLRSMGKRDALVLLGELTAKA